ncbi:MAG: hypothetical protein EF813_08320 [Methanosarcinales archaeon]|nr:MAG: hypothetical protein EF813_08320 [Methanosarcinales archaeon]
MTKRVPKTLEQKLLDLDAHLFLLREHLHKEGGSASHLKVISAELRTLVCFSSSTEGLLWRLTKELGVDDSIFLHVPGKLKQDHPLARGLRFSIISIQRGGKGDPHLTPYCYSLKEVIKDSEALVAAGKPLTHEQLIKKVAQQMGTAHEDEGLEPALVNLKSIFVGGVEPFVPVLATDAELTLEIGERVLELGEMRAVFERQPHKHNYGDISIVVRLRIKQHITGRIHLLGFHSYVSDVDVSVAASPSGIVFTIAKHDSEARELLAKYPEDWVPGTDAVFVFSYCSRTRQARTITNGKAHEVVNSCDVGWVHAGELVLGQTDVDHIDFVEKHFLLTYERLLSSQDSKSLYELPPNGYGLLKYSDEIEGAGAFPE